MFQDCLIIGGGVIGAMTALELAENGVTVSLLEKGELGKESSWAGGGILSPLQPWKAPPELSALVSWSQLAYPALAERLYNSTGINPELYQSGYLSLDNHETQAAMHWAEKTGTWYKHLTGHQLVNLCPHINSKTQDQGVFFPKIGNIRNPRLMQALKVELSNKKIELREQCAITKIISHNNQVSGVKLSNGETISTPAVIIAAGAWSKKILEKAAEQLTVTPVQGQMLRYNCTPGLLNQIIYKNDHYLIPRKDGSVLAGSTVEYVGFQKQTTTTAYEKLSSIAESILPALAAHPKANHWAGLRPGSTNSLPTISKHPNIEGLYINAGHFRNGLVTAPASAKLMADIYLQKEPTLDPTPFQWPLNNLPLSE